MNKKIYLIITTIIVLVALSQWIMVQMVYNKQIEGDLAINIAELYNLKAATIHKNDTTLEIYLDDFLRSKKFVNKLLAIKDPSKNEQLFSLPNDDIDSVVWENIMKRKWLESIVNKQKIDITDEDLNQLLNLLEHRNFLEQSKEYNIGITREEYVERVIKPIILESKVYVWLLENFNDFDGMQKAQMAYESLESGRDFAEVISSYSDEQEYSRKTFWFEETDLVEHYEPIKRLNVGEFSKIVIAPGPNGVYYTIWYLDSITTDEEVPSYGVRGIYIKARTLDQFFNDFLLGADINLMY